MLVVNVQIDDIDSEDDEDLTEPQDSDKSQVVSMEDESNPEIIDSTDALELPSKRSSSHPKKQRSWLNDRVGISLGAVIISLVLLIAAGAMVATIGWYARDGYHVGVVADQVVIQKGRVGGLLWFDPTLEQWTEIQVAQLNNQDLRRLTSGKQLADLAEAQAFVAALRTRLVDPTSEALGDN